MALCPFAEKRLIPESETQDKITPRMVIMHSAGGAGSLYGWWMNPDSKGLESHFWVSFGGRIEQYVDTNVQADANGKANGYAVSIETESTREATEPWTPQQEAAIIRLLNWLCQTHNIPRSTAKTPTGSGIAWHVQFGAPGPWTSVRGKVCPGPARIRQLQDVIVPALQTVAPPVGDTFMPALTPEQQADLYAKVQENHLRLIELQEEVVGKRDAKGDSRMDRIAALVSRIAGKG